MNWLRKTAARVLMRASSALMTAGLKLAGAIPDAEPEDDDTIVPPQDPLTPEARAMLVRPIAEPQPKAKVIPLEGSNRARYLKRRKARGFDT